MNSQRDLSGQPFQVDRPVRWEPLSPLVQVHSENSLWLIRDTNWMRLPLEEDTPTLPETERLDYMDWRPFLALQWEPSPWGTRLRIYPDPPQGVGGGLLTSPVLKVTGAWLNVTT